MLIILVSIVVAFLVQFQLYKWRLMKNIRHLPVAKGLPLIGVGHRFIGKSTTGNEIWVEKRSDNCTKILGYKKLRGNFILSWKFSFSIHEEIYHEIINLCETYQNPSIIWFGPILVIVVSSAEDMQTVLNSPDCLQKAHLYDNLDVNDGLFKSKGNFLTDTLQAAVYL